MCSSRRPGVTGTGRTRASSSNGDNKISYPRSSATRGKRSNACINGSIICRTASGRRLPSSPSRVSSSAFCGPCCRTFRSSSRTPRDHHGLWSGVRCRGAMGEHARWRYAVCSRRSDRIPEPRMSQLPTHPLLAALPTPVGNRRISAGSPVDAASHPRRTTITLHDHACTHA
jgi:hypothetical protein